MFTNDFESSEPLACWCPFCLFSILLVRPDFDRRLKQCSKIGTKPKRTDYNLSWMLMESIPDIFNVLDIYAKFKNWIERNSLHWPNWETTQIELELNQFDNKGIVEHCGLELWYRFFWVSTRITDGHVAWRVCQGLVRSTNDHVAWSLSWGIGFFIGVVPQKLHGSEKHNLKYERLKKIIQCMSGPRENHQWPCCLKSQLRDRFLHQCCPSETPWPWEAQPSNKIKLYKGGRVQYYYNFGLINICQKCMPRKYRLLKVRIMSKSGGRGSLEPYLSPLS